MVRGIAAATLKLKGDLDQPVTRRTAADLFREIEPLDDDSAAELMQLIRESREESRRLEATQEPPAL